MTRFGVDYAWANPAPLCLKKHGVRFVCRYLSHDPKKNLRSGEAKLLLANGIAIVTVWESTASRALSGHGAGQEDASNASRLLHELGAPADAPVYFAVDWDAQPQQQHLINEYLVGAATVLGSARVGIYGGYYVIKRALDAGVAHYAWQTYAWSGGQWDTRAHIQQYLNGQRLCSALVDYDRADKDDFGQWGGAVEPVVFHPKKPASGRPADVPKRIPAWVWKFIAWRQRRLRSNRGKQGL